MKTLKIAFIALMAVTLLASQARADGFEGKPVKVAHMTFERAVKDPGLVNALYDQVDPGFLNRIEQLYVVEVKYNGAVYKILGSRQNWLKLFRHRLWPVLPGKAKPLSNGGLD